MTVVLAPLATLSGKAKDYPTEILDGCETGLLLFAAAFLGINDAIHFARRDLACVCVDRDQQKLGEMAALYPSDWAFVEADAWDFARQARAVGRRWDAVSVDTFTGNATDRSIETIDLWCDLADRCITVTIGHHQDFNVPEGWSARFFPRSHLAHWLVLRRNP